MSFSPELADVRFGCGLSPVIASPASPLQLLTGLTGPDEVAARFPIPTYAQMNGWLTEAQRMRRAAFSQRDEPQLMDDLKAYRQAQKRTEHRWTAAAMLRQAHSPTPFRERLVGFWADHFTAMGKIALLRTFAAPYIEEAIRPNIAGTFGDLLIAAVTHPVMLHYLDQDTSTGPNARATARQKRLGGLNENLAREVIELHTLGVDGPYTQTDVRELAELFTGLTYTIEEGFRFRPMWAEPGAETVLGRSYGGTPAQLEPVLQALRDLALHPATAQHLARKLAVHFTADDPDPDLVAHVRAAYLASGGDLMRSYAALLEHPTAWTSPCRNVKPPADLVGSSWRALAVDPGVVAGLDVPDLRRAVVLPLAEMAQDWLRAPGPDGWPEEDAAWITPQGLSARLRWAVNGPRLVCPELPDPRIFADTALGPFATETVRFAARAAESRPEAIGLVLCSPAFQRR